MTKKQIQKEADRICGLAFKKHGSHAQFSIFDLGRLFKEADTAFKEGCDIDLKMIDLVAKYRK